MTGNNNNNNSEKNESAGEEVSVQTPETPVMTTTSTTTDGDKENSHICDDKNKNETKDDDDENEEEEEEDDEEGNEEEEQQPEVETTMIAQYTEEFLLEKAREMAAKRTEDWEITKNSTTTTNTNNKAKAAAASPEDRIPRFHRDEIELGKLIGKGGYFYVIEVTEINLREDEIADYEYNTNDDNDNDNGEGELEGIVEEDQEQDNEKKEEEEVAKEDYYEQPVKKDTSLSLPPPEGDDDNPIVNHRIVSSRNSSIRSIYKSNASSTDSIQESLREVKLMMPEYDNIMMMSTNKSSSNNNNNNTTTTTRTNHNNASTTSRRKVRKITQKMEDYIESGLVVQNRKFMSKHCLRLNSKTGQTECRYALKTMKPEHRETPRQYMNTVVDLAIEAKFLAAVRHPNIIKMRAMSIGDDLCQPHAYIIMDRLYHTLNEKIYHIWKKKEDGGLYKVFDFGHKRQHAFIAERLAVAYDIADALHYLHELNIIYRDLKPNNIGFDVRGDAKLFDFGLATEYDPEKEKNKPFKLTGDTGTIRYMAPEVAQKFPYNETADVYSFGILLWEMLALKVPYEDTSEYDIERKVIMGGVRPKIDSSWPNPIRRLLQDIFASKHRRPKMDVVCDVLMKEIHKLSHGSRHLTNSSSINDSYGGGGGRGGIKGSSGRFPQESARSALSDQYFD